MGLFELAKAIEEQPLVVSYGMGVDSTSMLVEFARKKIRPDLILFANVGGPYFDRMGGEKEETYEYLPIMNRFLQEHEMPTVTVVRYIPKNFKNWPPYYSLEENCLTNGTLPSKAFGFGSCSQKWKASPQHKFLTKWQPAQICWQSGRKIKKVIGYDCGPADMRRHNYIPSAADLKLYDFWHPLVEWQWDRARCMHEIEKAGIPVPPKSSCFFCPAMKPWEVEALPKDKLCRLVIMEARAAPRLTKVDGLWGKATKKRPGSMTEFIQEQKLLPEELIDRLIHQTPTEIKEYQANFRAGRTTTSFGHFIDRLVQIERTKAA
jgi:hypothetical protein